MNCTYCPKSYEDAAFETKEPAIHHKTKKPFLSMTYLCSPHVAQFIKKKHPHRIRNIRGYEFRPCDVCLKPMLLNKENNDRKCFICM